MGARRNGFEPGMDDGFFRVQTVEILRRPGQTLGFYIREGNGRDRGDGIFISRIAAGSETSGLLQVMDEILAVDKVDVTRMSLDDVAILMSIPKRLVLTIRTRKSCPKNVSCPSLSNYEAETSSSTCRPSPAHAHNSPSSTFSSLSCDPLRQQQQQQQQQQQVYVRKGRVASAGDVTDSEFGGDVIQSYAGSQQQFCSYGTISSGVRRPLDVARSLSHRPWTLEQDSTLRRLKGSLPGMRERAVDILEELIGQRQSRRNHVIGRWSEHRKSLVDSPGRSAGRRRADYSSDTDAHLGPDQTPTPTTTGPGAGGARANSLANRLSESQLFHDQKAFCNEAILLRPGLQSAGGGRSLSNTRENSPERYSSDSESNGSKRGISDRAHLAAFARHSSYLNRLLGRDDRYATLPQQLHSVANSQELRHWLRKLDNLAVELESQQLAANNNSNNNSHASIGVSPTERRERTLSASAEMECYTAQEYRSWVGGRQTPSPSSAASSSSDHHPPLSVSFSLSSSPRIQAPSSSSSSSSVAASRKLSAESIADFRNLQQLQTGSESAKIQTDPSSSGGGGGGGQRRLLSLSSSTQTWRGGGGGGGHHRSPSNSSSKSSLVTASRSRQSPSSSAAAPSSSSSSAFQTQIPSKQVVDRLAACSILKDLSMAKKPTPLRTDDFVPYPAPAQVIDDQSTRRRSDPGPYDGSVYVHVICGHGLKASRTMLRDLYCVLAVDSVNKARTMIRTGAINFDWNEDFEVDVIGARRMSFLVYSWDPTTKHSLCFSASVSLQAFLRGAHHPAPAAGAHGLRRLALRLEPKGVLYVELICRDPRVVFQRNPATDQNAIFGASLETIVRREATSDNIPIVIRRCVDEIESRGLSHVGLYRLCGSARRKEQLKSDFECNASCTELTPQAVSDISVITGVVKDFLLRLPEPVFTSALHQMLLDAISVRIPEDPEGNSKLMFSVIECLPKINQDVVAFLMNHLKRIVAKKETNKMDAASLSTCFGPIMLCPPQDTSLLKQTADFKRQAEVLRYILDIWPNDQDGSLKRSPREQGTPRSDLLPRQQSQDSNPTKPSADSSRTTTTALVHSAPAKTSFC